MRCLGYAVAASLSLGGQTLAAYSITSVSRSMSGLSATTGFGVYQTSNSGSSPVSTPSFPNGTGSFSVGQNSNVTNSGVTVTSMIASASLSSASPSSTYGSFSGLTMVFDVTAPQSVAYDFSFPNGFFIARLTGPGGATVLNFFTGASSVGSTTLGAGTYTLNLSASPMVDGRFNTFMTSSMSGTFLFVPSPGSAALLGCAGLLALRRRR